MGYIEVPITVSICGGHTNLSAGIDVVAYIIYKNNIYTYIYIPDKATPWVIEVWGEGVLNGKCSARGPKKLIEAIAD